MHTLRISHPGISGAHTAATIRFYTEVLGMEIVLRQRNLDYEPEDHILFHVGDDNFIAYFLPREDQYFAITAPDGSFEIANLPAGEVLEFQLWHESSAGANGALEVQSSQTEGVDWRSKGRFRIKLEENETRELVIPVPASAFAAG